MNFTDSIIYASTEHQKMNAASWQYWERGEIEVACNKMVYISACQRQHGATQENTAVQPDNRSIDNHRGFRSQERKLLQTCCVASER